MYTTYFILLTALYLFLHSFLAHDKVKECFYKTIVPERYYRLFFVFYAVTMLLPIYYYYRKTEKIVFFDTNIITAIFGSIFVVISVVAFYSAFKGYNIHEFLGTDRIKNKHKPVYPFVATGLNRLTRHPLYTFSYPLLVGLFLFSPDHLILIASFLVIVYFPVGIYFEEQKLLKTYGEEYKNYIKQTPKLIPTKYSFKEYFAQK